ncbi:carbon storage regulator [Stratiformator vulcanicus]|uniref:Translational regulator CsrA n=1 Tax=Stratiformator vulcanicus TaxID=2527980 RepID=A0A517R2R7_9PLAN|nr:carbon storage regulator [Stratiformator vulcanicus]QDT38177.1 hypothetical protein Pan189_25670 [Stratiformator vulcanicus]
MLVLTRKQAETIQIGDNVTIKVIRTGKGSVKIGIDAPSDIRVLRGELAVRDEEPTGEDDAEKAVVTPDFEDSAAMPATVSYSGYFVLPQAV